MMDKKVFIIIISLVCVIAIALILRTNKKKNTENIVVINEPTITMEEETIELEPSMEEMELYIDPVTGKNVDPKTGKEI